MAQAWSTDQTLVRGLLDGAVRWLLSQRMDPDSPSAIPYVVAPEQAPEPSRSAWCYGDPGVAATLLLATRAMGERIGKLGIEVLDAHVAGAKDPNALLQTLGPEAGAAAFRKAIAEASPLTVNGTEEKTESARAGAVGESSPAAPKVACEEAGGWRVMLGTRSYRVRGLSPVILPEMSAHFPDKSVN